MTPFSISLQIPCSAARSTSSFYYSPRTLLGVTLVRVKPIGYWVWDGFFEFGTGIGTSARNPYQYWVTHLDLGYPIGTGFSVGNLGNQLPNDNPLILGTG
jgi:hypothetical protein